MEDEIHLHYYSTPLSSLVTLYDGGLTHILGCRLVLLIVIDALLRGSLELKDVSRFLKLKWL